MGDLFKKDSEENKFFIYEFTVGPNGYQFAANIQSAMSTAESELMSVSERLEETEESLKKLTPECDKLDYILAASSGVLCGLLDVFLVGKPGESPIGDLTDKWFEDRTKDFAKLSGWTGKDNDDATSAVRYLEKTFKIPYDQRGAGDAGGKVFDLTPKNHHFKSLAHNPTLLGLFFSILDQWNDTSHFVTDGRVITLEGADELFELRGETVPAKLFFGFLNWFGHLISDMSGSSGSVSRGMGIPSPIWSWSNDIIAIKDKLHITPGEFDQSLNDLAQNIYNSGYDARFQSAQCIPVFFNELIVRLMYSVRRMITYYQQTEQQTRSFKALWKACEPFSNASVKRMLTVAHGSFCVVDAGDAAIRGLLKGQGAFDVGEFVMRLNIIGIGRFSISLYGEAKRAIQRMGIDREVVCLTRERTILLDYIEGLRCLEEVYDDESLLVFVQDLQNSELYIENFEKTVALAEKRGVPDKKILHNKAEIDAYFAPRRP
ncbi:MAG: hypothetical protein Q4B73_08355 [Lachnospiraceae bacterium]|nr:hypothetical protein [Lachnospiraceae bacterium]